jgi:hypothetical protein
MFKYLLGVLGTIGAGLLAFSFYRKYKSNEKVEINNNESNKVKEVNIINKEKVKETLTNHKKLSKDIINIIINIINKSNIITKLRSTLLHELINNPNKIFYMKFIINYEHNVNFIKSLLGKNGLKFRKVFRFDSIIMCAEGKGSGFFKLLENDAITNIDELAVCNV